MLYNLDIEYFNYDSTDKPVRCITHLSVIGEENAYDLMEEFANAENFVKAWMVDSATGELLAER